MLAPFAKEPFEVTLTGITNGTDDPSVSSVCFVMVVVNAICDLTRLTTIECVQYRF